MIKNIFNHNKVKAGIIFILALTIFLSLVSYNPSDPSFNLASDNLASNYLSNFGSYLSDFLYQSFGLSSYVIIICLVFWSCSIFFHGEITLLWLRILCGAALVITSSYIFTTINIETLPASASGFVGKIILESEGANLVQLYLSDTTSMMIASLLLFLLMPIGLGFKFALYWKSLAFIYTNIGKLFSKLPITQKIKSKLNKIDTGHAFYAHENFADLDDSTISTTNDLQNDIPVSTSTNFSSEENDKIRPVRRSAIKNSLSSAKIAMQGATNQLSPLPPLDLLDKEDSKTAPPLTTSEIEERSSLLLKVLQDFGIKGRILNVQQGPVVTLYEFEPAAGTKSSRIIGLADDIARSLSALSTRIAVIPGRNALGIELPNKQRIFFRLRGLIETDAFRSDKILLPLILGKELGGAPYVADLAKMPHLLVAGTTGSGKSVAINAMIMSLLYRYGPDECKMIMIDPKMLELSAYDNIPHLLSPVVTEPGKAVVALKWAVREMENRYRLMSHLGVRNIASFNNKILDAIKKDIILNKTVQTGFDPESGQPITSTVPIEMKKMPFIVVIVDEMADLMLVAGKDIETSIQRLAQMARAAGIHIIMATQRPSVDVITGVIKANFPSRISFRVTSKIDSRTILGEQGSEQLLGMGDMLYMGSISQILRVHGPFVDDSEVERVANYLRSTGSPDYVKAVTEDEEADDEIDQINQDSSNEGDLYNQALYIVKTKRKASISYIQRSLRIGYNRAANIVEKMESEGILSSPNHSGKREILIEED